MSEKTISDIIGEHETNDLYSAIIDALSKQIPYKPEPYKNYSGKCKCGVIFLDKSTKYCGNCGQRLEWGKV